MRAKAITKPRTVATAMQKKRSSHKITNDKKRPDLTNMRLQSASSRVMFPIWMLAWLTVATIKSCLAEETNDDYLPDNTYECDSPCEVSSFCGRDFKCHTYSCENWYTLGHPTMTGYTPDKSPMLNCKILENGQDRSFLTQREFCYSGIMPTSVSFLDGCDPFSRCWDGSTPVVHFNHKCTTTPSDGFGFVCYDMGPDTDFEAYYEDYIAATADLDRVPCTEFNDTSTDNHGYNVYRGSPRIGFFDNYYTSEFNATLAMKTLVAELFEVKNETLFPYCEDGCKDTQFCGQDGTCHEYNCVNVYDYGPKTVTGHDYQETSAPKLECSPEPPTIDDTNICLDSPHSFYGEITSTVESPWPLLIRYYCSVYERTSDSSGYSVHVTTPAFCAYDFLDGRYATLNRFCSAQPNPYQTFTCYDMDPGTDIEQYLADYLNKTTFNSECTKDNTNIPEFYSNENTYLTYEGSHSYFACIGSSSYSDCPVVSGSVNFHDSELVPIDYERLRHVMLSGIFGFLPEGNGTSPIDTSSVPTTNGIGTAITFVFALIGLIVEPQRRHRGSTSSLNHYRRMHS